jgi:nitrile hydratase accessory protein
VSLIDHRDIDSVTSLPRSNGELVFEEPWESRAFGMAAALADFGVFSWADFQDGLIKAIAEEDNAAGEEARKYRYYERWLAVLESLIVERRLVALQEIDKRATELCRRPAGHDHIHDHEHDHAHDSQAGC